MVVAPGKLVIAGEYAILRPGGLGVVAAAGPGIPARAQELKQPGSGRLHLHSQLLSGGPWRAQFSGGEWSPPPPDEVRFVAAAVAALHEGRASFDVALEVGLPGWLAAMPPEVTSKPGLGGSSAATVAALCAVAIELGSVPSSLFPLALAAHRTAQGGLGSGIDVAASLFGGLLLFENTGVCPSLKPLVWPKDWPILPIFSGASCKTLGRIRRFEAWCSGDEARASLWVRESNDLVRHLIDAIEDRSYERFCAGVGGCRAHLLRLGAWAGIEIEGAGLERLARAVGDRGACKQSGAGGGDSGFVLPRDPEDQAGLRRVVLESGLFPMDLELFALGATARPRWHCSD